MKYKMESTCQCTRRLLAQLRPQRHTQERFSGQGPRRLNGEQPRHGGGLGAQLHVLAADLGRESDDCCFQNSHARRKSLSGALGAGCDLGCVSNRSSDVSCQWCRHQSKLVLCHLLIIGSCSLKVAEIRQQRWEWGWAGHISQEKRDIGPTNADGIVQRGNGSHSFVG